MNKTYQRFTNQKLIFSLIIIIFLFAFMVKAAKTEYIWQLSRITALIALTLAFFVSTLPLGVSLSSKLKRISNKYHRKVSVVLFFVSGIHIISVLFDQFRWSMIQEIKQIVFISKENTLSVAISVGVLCLYLLIVVTFSGIFSKKMIKKYSEPIWRGIHKAGITLYPLAYIHAVWIGYDFENTLIFAFFSILLLINIIGIIFNLIHITKPILKKNNKSQKNENKNTKYKEIRKRSILIIISLIIPMMFTGIIISGNEKIIIDNINNKYLNLNIFNGNIQNSNSHLLADDISFTESEIKRLMELNIDENDAILAGQVILSECKLKEPRRFNTHPYYRYLLDCDGEIISILHKDTPDLKLEEISIGSAELNWINEKIPYYDLYVMETDPLIGELKILATDGKPLSLDVEYALEKDIK